MASVDKRRLCVSLCVMCYRFKLLARMKKAEKTKDIKSQLDLLQKFRKCSGRGSEQVEEAGHKIHIHFVVVRDICCNM